MAAPPKLSAEDAEAIRNDQRRHRAIAVEYGIHISYVSHIKSGRAWAKGEKA